MAQRGQRKCLCCHDLLLRPLAGVRVRRRVKRYFRGMQAAHPGYARGRPRGRPALQDSLPEQTSDRATPIKSPGGLALQELLNPSAVLAGLIAHLFEVSLQDDMAATTRRLVQRART